MALPVFRPLRIFVAWYTGQSQPLARLRRSRRLYTILVVFITCNLMACSAIAVSGENARIQADSYSDITASGITASDTAAEQDGAQLRLARWQQLLSYSHQLTTSQTLRRINRFFNQQVRFEDDITVWQRTDYWATPRETLLKAAGDCEDFAIAKYISLLQIGIKQRQLRLIYVKALSGPPDSPLQQAHMVLAYYPESDAEPLILDNLISDIRPASQRPDLIPIFSFNSEGIWVTGRRTTASPGTQLSGWQSVLLRMRQEGLYRRL
ncbi:MAG: transglutaminase-like cysteine peptidase [Marinobacterium sp.]|nr:transglutaminase-like cysteine peptidase [Marinobacterium sp.]